MNLDHLLPLSYTALYETIFPTNKREQRNMMLWRSTKLIGGSGGGRLYLLKHSEWLSYRRRHSAAKL